MRVVWNGVVSETGALLSDLHVIPQEVKTSGAAGSSCCSCSYGRSTQTKLVEQLNLIFSPIN